MSHSLTRFAGLVGLALVCILSTSLSSAARMIDCTPEEEKQIQQEFTKLDSEELSKCYNIFIHLKISGEADISHLCNSECAPIIQSVVKIKVPDCASELLAIQQELKQKCDLKSEAQLLEDQPTSEGTSIYLRSSVAVIVAFVVAFVSYQA